MQTSTFTDVEQHTDDSSVHQGLVDMPPQGSLWTPLQVLRSNEFQIPKSSFTKRRFRNRASLIGWWISQARTTLELKYRTIDIAIRLFDFYSFKVYEQNLLNGFRNNDGDIVHILDSSYESKLSALTCFFMAAKYEEIYPPILNDFLYYEENNKIDKIDRDAVLQREIDIIKKTDVKMTISLITDWFNLYCPNKEKRMPHWGYVCYIHIPHVKSEDLAKAIYEVYQVKTTQVTEECVKAVLKELNLEIPQSLSGIRSKVNKSRTEKKV